MLQPDYWLARLPNADAPIFTPETRDAFNARVRDAIGIPAVLDLPDALPATEVQALIPTFSPQSAPYGTDGQPLPAEVWQAVEAACARDRVPDPAPVRFALVVRRTAVRALPTDFVALKKPGDLPFDRLQETTLDPGWPVAVVHQSPDGHWAFGLTPGYWGWVHTRDLAFCSRDAARAFATADPALVVTGAWGDVAGQTTGDHLVAEMGTRLPLLDTRDGLHVAQIPRRDAAGHLHLVEGYIAASDPDWHIGWLPPTLRTVITQAFRVLGEPYAWGGARLGRAGRDCSRLVQDAWAVTGVQLPRNSGQQGRIGVPAATFAPDESHAERLRRLQSDVPPGALLLLPGHVMLYLGTVAGIPYAIHDLWGYAHPEGHTTRAAQVVVSALPPEPSPQGHTLLERLTHAIVVAPL